MYMHVYAYGLVERMPYQELDLCCPDLGAEV